MAELPVMAYKEQVDRLRAAVKSRIEEMKGVRQELWEAQADNARLRAALEQIASGDDLECLTVELIRQRARRALAEG